ncbi:MAM and LDL-receptor class A domain-containing protein 1-like isoform X2 [Mytilus californianus]|uniref:MAM and LDL-receptor class A domain-containing protein 1-like isoform X2 n=1 Tax=Mytilus californianus TaxID=6549 RepID=UPI002246951E|nr:MAM and LDL-receptor class A domain-containing protein 1-like isoform X2 [Mytilus californianus]
MDYYLNVLLSLIYLFVFVLSLVQEQSDVRTETIPIDAEVSISCGNDSTISIEKIYINRISTPCTPKDYECSLTDDVLNVMKINCDKKLSCTIDMHAITTNTTNCLTDFGYFNFSYACNINVLSCDFENNWCNWSKKSNNSEFQWKRVKNDTNSTIFPRDHTTASSNGSYAYIYSSVSQKDDVAKLITENIVSSKNQCLSFWHYMTDSNHVIEVIHNEQNVYNVTGPSENRWIRTEIPIQQYFPNSMYTITFKVVSRMIDIDGVIALDDIMLVNRACEGLFHQCDFEYDMCNWHTSKKENETSEYSWSRHKRHNNTLPETDHTTGSENGYYMYLNGTLAFHGDKAYIKSPILNALSETCLSFWYYMNCYGNGSGGLNVTVNENLVFIKYEDHGNQWIEKMINIVPIENLTIEFIGVFVKDDPCDIALDDIALTPGSCSGWYTQQYNCANIDRNTMVETCPTKYVDMQNVSLSFEPEKEICLEYEIKERFLHNCTISEDEKSCELNLSSYVQRYPECFRPNEIQIQYKCEGFQEKTFVSNSSIISCAGNTTITIVDLNVEQYPTPCSEYKQCNLTEEHKTLIKMSCNKETSCTISTIIPNTCLFKNYGHVSISYSCTRIVNGSCTFENDLCGWSVSSNGTYQWIHRRGQTLESSTGPDRDHTTASGDGYYMYAYTKSEWGSQPKEESDLFSGWIGPNPKQCLTFWYLMHGEQINTLKVFQMDSESTIELWNKSANQGNKWYFQSLSLNDIGLYRIKFKAIRGNGSKIEIAIDDISITNTDCKKVSSLDCNFEGEPCNWNVEQETEYMWTVISGGTHPNDTGPEVDHTDGFYDGNYIYLNASNIEPGQKSNFTSVTVSSEGDACFTFWFHMHGDGMGTLNVYLVSETMTPKIWSRSGNKPDLWQLAFVDISMLDSYQMTLEGVRGSTKKGDIAVDDISLLPGSCNKRAFFLDCNFEAEKCNWLAGSETPYIWTSTSTVVKGPNHDHTIGTVDGHYMYLEGPNISEGMKSKLTSTIINPDGDICFTFWYHMNREEIGTLSVYTESRNTTQMHWSQSGKNSTWIFANFTISKSEPYRIIFEGVRGNGYFGGIALDDISLLESSCSGLIKTSQKCHKIDESISLHECSKYYLQLNDTSLVFDREFDNCSAVYQDVQTSITTVCNDMKDSDICTFNLQELVIKDQRCFQSNWLSVEYRCEAEVTSTVSSVASSSKGSSEGEETTTVASDTTLSAETTVPLLLTSEAQSQGLIVGLVIGSFVLVFIAAVIFLIRRFLLEKNNLEKIDNLQGNYYIGHQTIALQQSSSPPQYEIVQNTNNQYEYTNIAMATSNECINNVENEDQRKHIAPLEDKTRGKYETKGNQYEEIDPTAISSVCHSKEDKPRVTENYTVLDPKETGFDRSKMSDKKQSYDLAKPISPNNAQYVMSKEGKYDCAGRSNHKELENIYNHAVDNVYDSGSYKRNDFGTADTYDHFVGQKNGR